MTVTLDLDKNEVELIFHYCLLRGVKGAINDPEEFEAECLHNLRIFDSIQNKLREALRRRS